MTGFRSCVFPVLASVTVVLLLLTLIALLVARHSCSLYTVDRESIVEITWFILLMKRLFMSVQLCARPVVSEYAFRAFNET